MRRFIISLGLVVALAGCHQSDNERTDLIKIDGVDCIVVRDGLGRIQRTDCDWEHS